jgi:hypothetical protein
MDSQVKRDLLCRNASRETAMAHRHFAVILTAIIMLSLIEIVAQQGPAFRTPWGEPDLQGIWSGETLTPVERPARFATRPVLTPQEAGAVEEEIHSRPGRDDRSARGTERDVARAYNQHWLPPAQKLVDGRTSLIVDPPDGKAPPLTPEAKKRTEEVRAYLQALLQGTSGGRPGPISPRRNEPPPMYNVARMNRSDGPEDRQTTERCFRGEHAESRVGVPNRTVTRIGRHLSRFGTRAGLHPNHSRRRISTSALEDSASAR